MSNCHIKNQVDEHVNKEPHDTCFNCNKTLTEDDKSTEIKAKRNGFQFVGDCCVEMFTDFVL